MFALLFTLNINIYFLKLRQVFSSFFQNCYSEKRLSACLKTHETTDVINFSKTQNVNIFRFFRKRAHDTSLALLSY